MNKLFSNHKNEKGQGLVEYAVIIALVAVVVIASMKFLGPKLSCTFESVNNSLPGAGSTSNCSTADAGSETNTNEQLSSLPPGQPTCSSPHAPWDHYIGYGYNTTSGSWEQFNAGTEGEAQNVVTYYNGHGFQGAGYVVCP